MSLPCQTGFSFLSVPDIQPVCAQGVFNQAVDSRNLNCNVVIEENMNWSANDEPFISPKSCGLVATADASAVHRADDLDADFMDLDVSDRPSTLEIVLEKYDPQRPLPRALLKMAPPKRFYRTFWRSVARRLVRQYSNAARPAAQSSCAVPT